MKQQAKMGRPPKNLADKRNKRITLRFRPGEFARLKDAARQSGKRFTTYLHDRLMGEEK